MTSCLFELVYIILDKKKQTAAQLAEHFGVSVRTVFRWVEQLCIAGVPLYMTKGRGGGISLMDGYVLDKTMLSDSEKADILASLNALHSVTPVADDAAVITKLSGMFKLSESVATNWVETDFSSWNNSSEEAAVFDRIKYAILNRCPVCFSYYNADGGCCERTVEPWRLVFRERSWYLWGWCRLRCAERFFKLRRISGLSIVTGSHEQAFSHEAASSATSHSAADSKTTSSVTFTAPVPQTSFRQSHGDIQWQHTHKPIPVTLRLSKNVMFRAYDEFPPESITPQKDGGAVIHLQVPASDWFYGYLLGFGTDVEVLEPESVRTEMTRRVNDLFLMYSNQAN